MLNHLHHHHPNTTSPFFISCRNAHKKIKVRKKLKIPTQDSNTTDCSIQYLEDTLSIIQYGQKKIFLIGTHHASLTSAQVCIPYIPTSEFSINFQTHKQVREVIEEVQPQTIILEVCKERANALMADIKRYKNMVKNGQKITAFQKKQLLIGGEFRTALQEGLKLKANIVYADMDNRILSEKFKYGLKKALKNPELSLNDRLKLRVGTITWAQWFGMKWNRESTINKLRTRKHMRERLDFMTQKAPDLQNGVMNERNDIISLAIRDCEGDLVVAVVGMDHMEGIEERFKSKFVGVDLNVHKNSREEMVREESMERLDRLIVKDQWIGHDFDEFKHYRDLPQKML